MQKIEQGDVSLNINKYYENNNNGNISLLRYMCDTGRKMLYFVGRGLSQYFQRWNYDIRLFLLILSLKNQSINLNDLLVLRHLTSTNTSSYQLTLFELIASSLLGYITLGQSGGRREGGRMTGAALLANPDQGNQGNRAAEQVLYMCQQYIAAPCGDTCWSVSVT